MYGLLAGANSVTKPGSPEAQKFEAGGPGDVADQRLDQALDLGLREHVVVLALPELRPVVVRHRAGRRRCAARRGRGRTAGASGSAARCSRMNWACWSRRAWSAEFRPARKLVKPLATPSRMLPRRAAEAVLECRRRGRGRRRADLHRGEQVADHLHRVDGSGSCPVCRWRRGTRCSRSPSCRRAPPARG